MSHLLQTTNPDAVERIENPTFGLPGVGSQVVYRSRIGHVRSGRSEFPATVLRGNDDGTVNLMVFMDRDEIVVEEHIRSIEDFATPSEANHCWRPIENPAEPAKEPSRLNAIRRDLDKLRAQVVGDYEEVPKSVYDILADFEERLLSIERIANDAVGRLKEAGLISED